MTVFTIFFLVLGLPCIGLGLWMRNAKPVIVDNKKNKKKKSNKKEKVKVDKSGAQSFIYGGLILTLVGVGGLIKLLTDS